MGPLLHKFFKLLLESSAPFVLQHMPVATLIILTASFPSYNSLPQDTGPVSWQGPWAAGQRPVRSDDLWGRVAPLGRSKDSVYVPKSYLCVSHAFQQHIPYAFAYIYSIYVHLLIQAENKKTWCNGTHCFNVCATQEMIDSASWAREPGASQGDRDGSWYLHKIGEILSEVLPWIHFYFYEL